MRKSYAVAPPREELVSLFDKYSLATMARMLKVGKGTLKKWFLMYSIPEDKPVKYGKGKRFKIEPEILISLYREKQSCREVAEILGVSHGTINYNLHALGYKVNSRGGNKPKYEIPPVEELQSKFPQAKTIRELGKLFGVSGPTVSRWLKLRKIVFIPTAAAEFVPTREELVELYQKKNKRMKEIADIYNVPARVVTNWFAKYKIPRNRVYRNIPPKEVLLQLIKDGYSRNDIANKYCVSVSSVWNWFSIHEINYNRRIMNNKPTINFRMTADQRHNKGLWTRGELKEYFYIDF